MTLRRRIVFAVLLVVVFTAAALVTALVMR